MSVYADSGSVVVDVTAQLHPDQALELIEDVKIAIGVARGRAVDERLGAGPVPPLSDGGTAVLEAEAAVERRGEPEPKPKPRRRASSKKGK